MSITNLSFLAPGNYDPTDPVGGLEGTLALFELGERLGYKGAWIRQRHLEAGVSSASVFLAAATQRTKTIELGTAVIPIGYESPFRLAEDLATVDVLSRGRLNVGLSAGRPLHYDLVAPHVYDGDASSVDLSYERIAKLAHLLESQPLADSINIPGGTIVPRLQPHARGLTERLWYGGGSLRSAEWAARNGFNFLASNVTSGEGTDSFVEAQLAQIRTFREAAPIGRKIAVGRVIVPTDGADTATRQRYDAYGKSRFARTLQPNGEKRTLFARDLVGTSEEIVNWLLIDPAVQLADELRLELPYEFRLDDYRQILEDAIAFVAPSIRLAA